MASSRWDFRGGQCVWWKPAPAPWPCMPSGDPTVPPSLVGTHLCSEPGFLFLLPWGRQRRKGH